MAEAFALANRIGVLDGGDLAICDAPEAVAASPDPRVRVFVDALTRAPRQTSGTLPPAPPGPQPSAASSSS
jgi:ABC-type proline/glycine betaine transport system ATPase subunit